MQLEARGSLTYREELAVLLRLEQLIDPAYRSMQEHDRAQEYYRSLETFLQDPHNLEKLWGIRSQNGLGQSERRRSEAALTLFNQAIAFFILTDRPGLVVSARAHAANVLIELQRYDEALRQLKLSGAKTDVELEIELRQLMQHLIAHARAKQQRMAERRLWLGTVLFLTFTLLVSLGAYYRLWLRSERCVSGGADSPGCSTKAQGAGVPRS